MPYEEDHFVMDPDTALMSCGALFFLGLTILAGIGLTLAAVGVVK